MTANRRIIKSAQQPLASLWEMPIFQKKTDGNDDAEPAVVTPKMPTAEDIEAIQKQAHDEAYKASFDKGFPEGVAKGHEEGLKKGYEEGEKKGIAAGQEIMRQKGEQFAALMQTLSEPLASLDDQVEEQIVALSIAIAKHLIRRELKTDPAQIVGTVRQAVSVLPIAVRDVRVLLHPQDAILVREALTFKEEAEDERRWRIVEDPALSRGGCIVETEQSRIDATVESRMASAIAQTLGGDREGDQREP